MAFNTPLQEKSPSKERREKGWGVVVNVVYLFK